MKRIVCLAVAILSMCLCFTACQKSYKPDPEVEKYLNGNISAENAFNRVKTVDYTVSDVKKKNDGTIIGTTRTRTFVDKSDDASYKVEITITVSDGTEDLSETKVFINRNKDKYEYSTLKDGKAETKEVDDVFVSDFITKLFYTYNDAYYEGGLYYGDYFMLYIYKYPSKFFYIDEENDLCVFHQARFVEYKDMGTVTFIQQTKINRLGLIESNSETYESQEKDFSLTSTLDASYVLF